MSDAPRIDDRIAEGYLRPHGGGLQRFLRLVLPWTFLWWFRIRAYGVEHVRRTGGVLLAPNHSSYMDPFVQTWPVKRVIRYMAKSTLFRLPVMGTVMRVGGAYPVERGRSDAGALDIGRELLLRGDVLIVYPEGTRFREHDELGPARRGAFRLAVETDADVVPVATYGLKPRAALGRSWWPPLGRVTLIYGEPMRFGHLPHTPEGAAQARDELWAEMERLYGLARELDGRRRRPRRWTVPPRDTP